MKHVATVQVKKIGVLVKNIYNIEVDFTMYAVIPLEVRWGDVEPYSQSYKDLGKVHRIVVVVTIYSSHGSLHLLQGSTVFSSRRISVS